MYKRQLPAKATMPLIMVEARPVTVMHPAIMPATAPVSYTHLDVYKRQTQMR